LRLHVHESGYEEHMEHEAVAPQKKRMRNNKVLILEWAIKQSCVKFKKLDLYIYCSHFYYSRWIVIIFFIACIIIICNKTFTYHLRVLINYKPSGKSSVRHDFDSIKKFIWLAATLFVQTVCTRRHCLLITAI
jgi:hypothetical protein